MKPTTNFAAMARDESRHIYKRADFITLRRSVERGGIVWYEDGEIEIRASRLYRDPYWQRRVEKDLGVGIYTASTLRGNFLAPDGSPVTHSWLRMYGTTSPIFLLDYESKMLVAAGHDAVVRYYDETSYPRCHATIRVAKSTPEDAKVRARLFDLVAGQMTKYKLLPDAIRGARWQPRYAPRHKSSAESNYMAERAREWALDKGCSLDDMPDQYGAKYAQRLCADAVDEQRSPESVVASLFNGVFVFTHDVSFLTWK